MLWRRTLVIASLLLAFARTVAAQDAAGSPATPPSTSFLSRADFYFEWSGLLTPDPRFTWMGGVGFDTDIIDFGAGRIGFSGDYQAVLGRERRRYDLNQGNYNFQVTVSRRIGTTEIAALLGHVSRHLADRENMPAISWNFAGVRVTRRFTAGSSTVETRIDAGRAMQQAFVDYVWMSDAQVDVRRALNNRVSLIGTAAGSVVTVNHLVRGQRVCGGQIEGGVRIRGEAAALELFAAYERRIDAFPTDRFRVRFFSLGFRIVSR